MVMIRNVMDCKVKDFVLKSRKLVQCTCWYWLIGGADKGSRNRLSHGKRLTCSVNTVALKLLTPVSVYSVIILACKNFYTQERLVRFSQLQVAPIALYTVLKRWRFYVCLSVEDLGFVF